MVDVRGEDDRRITAGRSRASSCPGGRSIAPVQELPNLVVFPDDQNLASIENRAVRAADDSNEHREHEVAN